MTWERYIRDKMRLGDTAVLFSNLYATDLAGLGCDALPATRLRSGPRVLRRRRRRLLRRRRHAALQLHAHPPVPRRQRSVARKLLKKLLPTPSRERIRWRASSTGSALRSSGMGGWQRPSTPALDGGTGPARRWRKPRRGLLRDPQGEVRSATAGSVVVVAWGMAAKHIVPEISGGSERRSKATATAPRSTSTCSSTSGGPSRKRAPSRCTCRAATRRGCTARPPPVGATGPSTTPTSPPCFDVRYLRKPGHPIDEQLKLNRYELEASRSRRSSADRTSSPTSRPLGLRPRRTSKPSP